ncbi:DUF6438 domain-containing protein [Kaistella palustris]|uniref:DUF6438 domain-containing protein n=1 Tax=Kaistella palustris TaxID=493376 RepID=UPI00040DD968|nr:DUF6438 domain-containing protein [Kaistella palustris]
MKYLITLLIAALLVSCTTQNSSKYSKIQYEAGACFGFCPVFKLTVNPDRTAVIEAEHFTFSEGHSKDEFSKPREGTFKTTLKTEDYNRLLSLLENVNLKSLPDLFKNKNVSDLPTAYLRINYTDGTSKNIEDYGKNGTPKLRELYNFLEGLRQSQTWEKVSD